MNILRLPRFIFICICAFLGVLFYSQIQIMAADIVHSGKSGDLDWSIDSDGLLLIKGTGDYAFDYSYKTTRIILHTCAICTGLAG